MNRFMSYLRPGILCQSAVIAGGYATGAELRNFFLGNGPVAGLLALLIPTLLWSVVGAISFEFVRVRCVDHATSKPASDAHVFASFARKLLPKPLANALQLTYFIFLLCVIALIAAMSGNIGQHYLQSNALGIGGMLFLIWLGSLAKWDTIEPWVRRWTVVLYVAFGGLLAYALVTQDLQIPSVENDWAAAAGSAIVFSAYNAVLIPVAFRSLGSLARREDTRIAGLLVGPIAMSPGILFFLALVPLYPEISDKNAVPMPMMVLIRDWPTWIQVLFLIAVCGAMARSGVVLLREISDALVGGIPRLARSRSAARPRFFPIVTLAGCGVAAAVFGSNKLLDRGYFWLGLVVMALFMLPILIHGLWHFVHARGDANVEPDSEVTLYPPGGGGAPLRGARVGAETQAAARADGAEGTRHATPAVSSVNKGSPTDTSPRV